ncbi:Phage tail tube protein, GTA-gp10 [Pseudovibrio denitrificans]|uniref:Phage tail tube protein, GTA-gp10 n=1 Tax=Pseudovibrio denitrificans TaxID=258256 RepID=A0A1I6YD47_9HYPH|nr:gene transfer agent family protein [Pseudovibrio denitrificans]SFT48423.1 Phage tail tube protein, GTA-gp10 [Pseudovibrio denitrificans]
MASKTYSRGVNRRRGEILAELGGQKHILVLTLGALAELEDTLNCTSLQQLTERFSEGNLRAADIIKVLGAGLRGGGLIIENEEVAELSHEGGVAALAKLAGELLVATFSSQQPHVTSKYGQS